MESVRHLWAGAQGQGREGAGGRQGEAGPVRPCHREVGGGAVRPHPRLRRTAAATRARHRGVRTRASAAQGQRAGAGAGGGPLPGGEGRQGEGGEAPLLPLPEGGGRVVVGGRVVRLSTRTMTMTGRAAATRRQTRTARRPRERLWVGDGGGVAGE